ncbi:hypothetical protein [Rhizobium rhizoryzae]|uniref:Putative hydrocarbon binding protein n=1 Tax=Rhizobium rhizoryzae TaxID=451876 RepID=A0A7W6LLV9_9HYPH|nr:hypothetical protein [Rhizobium rhizoryzae]MBB4145657.1 putative hydrocarbon binding protein [Rhizobium rhizoryzae]
MNLSQSFQERLRIYLQTGELRDGDIRYLIMRTDALMGMFTKLEPVARDAALLAMAESVAEFGGKSVDTYRVSGADNSAELISLLIRTSAELGWGAWTFTEECDGEVQVLVRNSPFACSVENVGTAVCAPIVGILTAIAPVLLGQGASAAETQCHQGRGGCCHFRISAASSKR